MCYGHLNDYTIWSTNLVIHALDGSPKSGGRWERFCNHKSRKLLILVDILYVYVYSYRSLSSGTANTATIERPWSRFSSKLVLKLFLRALRLITFKDCHELTVFVLINIRRVWVLRTRAPRICLFGYANAFYSLAKNLNYCFSRIEQALPLIRIDVLCF